MIRFLDGRDVFGQVSVHKIVQLVSHSRILFVGIGSDHGSFEVSGLVAFGEVVFGVEGGLGE